MVLVIAIVMPIVMVVNRLTSKRQRGASMASMRVIILVAINRSICAAGIEFS